MADTQKSTIYVDVDDEITSIIEKLREAKHKIVALVLPKRATVLQSIVNMKLLKRTAQEQNKKLVLITSEASLLPLAGAVGVHVAKTLQSKPVIPEPPDMSDKDEVADTDEEEDDIDKSKSVGELAGDDEAPAKVAAPEETINIDDIDEDVPAAKKTKKSKVKIPNFDKFRTRLIFAAIGTALLIVFLFFATKVWPHATITIKTNTTTVNTNFDFTASTDAQSVSTSSNTVPAVMKDTKQTDSQKVAATGQKNIGERATGTVSLKNCTASVNGFTVPSGTAVSAEGQTYVTQAAVALPATTKNGLNQCTTTTKDVVIKASNPGTSGNIASGSSFTVSGYNGVTGTNSASLAGGTDKNVTVVSQDDVNKAKKKITENNDEAKQNLIKQFEADSLLPLPVTMTAGKQTVSADPKVGTEAEEVEVTVDSTYTMLGVKQEDLAKLVQDEAQSSLEKNQKITDDGLKQATYTVKDKKSASVQTIAVETKASTGVQIDTVTLKTKVKGKKKGDVVEIAQSYPSVESVDVSFSPFWVNKVPSNPSKVTINVENTQVSNDQNSGN